MRKTPELVALGAAIRKRRHQLKFSQEEFADQARLDRTYVGGLERGERNLGYRNLCKVAAALRIPLSQLVRDTE